MPQVVPIAWLKKDQTVPIGQLVLSDDSGQGASMAFRYDKELSLIHISEPTRH